MITAFSKKRRVMITVDPLLYEEVKSLPESVSALVEIALQKYLVERKKEEVEKNLLAAALDPERQKDDLSLAQDFFHAEK